MRSRLHRDATPRHATEYLLHGFRCGRQFVLQNNFSCFIQDAVRTRAISQIQPNGQLSLKNVFSTRPHSANLLHCRSPFHCASSTSNIGSVSHPAGDRPSHPIWLVAFTRSYREFSRFSVSIRHLLVRLSVEQQLSSELERQNNSTRKDKQNAIHGHRHVLRKRRRTPVRPVHGRHEQIQRRALRSRSLDRLRRSSPLVQRRPRPLLRQEPPH